MNMNVFVFVFSMGGEKLVAYMLVSVLGLALLRSVFGQHMPEEPCSVQILVPGLKGTVKKHKQNYITV